MAVTVALLTFVACVAAVAITYWLQSRKTDRDMEIDAVRDEIDVIIVKMNAARNEIELIALSKQLSVLKDRLAALEMANNAQ